MNRPVSARVKTVKASLLTQFTRCQTLKRYCLVPWHSALDLGPDGSVFTLSPSITVPHSTINGIQVTTMFLGTAVTFWLDPGEGKPSE
jgi:hypothetical protein